MGVRERENEGRMEGDRERKREGERERDVGVRGREGERK